MGTDVGPEVELRWVGYVVALIGLIALALVASSDGRSASADEPTAADTVPDLKKQVVDLKGEVLDLRMRLRSQAQEFALARIEAGHAKALLETARRAAKAAAESVPRVSGSDVLADLPGVRVLGWVLTENVNANARQIGVTVLNALKEKVELVLRRNGVPLVSSADNADTPGSPCLYVSVHVVGSGFNVHVRLSEHVRLERRNVSVRATTWDRESRGTHGGDGDHVLRHVATQVEEFARAWLKQNPKK